MVFSNVIVDVTISHRSFVFGHSRAKVSARLTNVRSLVVTALILILDTAPCLSSGLSLSLTLPYNIRVAHKPITILQQLLNNVKDYLLMSSRHN